MFSITLIKSGKQPTIVASEIQNIGTRAHVAMNEIDDSVPVSSGCLLPITCHFVIIKVFIKIRGVDRASEFQRTVQTTQEIPPGHWLIKKLACELSPVRQLTDEDDVSTVTIGAGHVRAGQISVSSCYGVS